MFSDGVNVFEVAVYKYVELIKDKNRCNDYCENENVYIPILLVICDKLIIQV